MTVSGSKSYIDGRFMPREACDPSETPDSKFGGLM